MLRSADRPRRHVTVIYILCRERHKMFPFTLKTIIVQKMMLSFISGGGEWRLAFAIKNWSLAIFPWRWSTFRRLLWRRFLDKLKKFCLEHSRRDADGSGGAEQFSKGAQWMVLLLLLLLWLLLIAWSAFQLQICGSYIILYHDIKAHIDLTFKNSSKIAHYK